MVLYPQILQCLFPEKEDIFSQPLIWDVRELSPKEN